MDDPLRGIVYQGEQGNISSLPLQTVHVNVFMVDVSARVTLRQTFANPSESATGRAKYVFPLPARAAPCAFELLSETGRRIIGVAKEKTVAEQEFENATRAGKTAALVNWVTDDVFTISIGSIPAKQTVTAKLVFVMELMDDELRDEVRLQLPMSVGCRYGQEPPDLLNTSSASHGTRLSITVDVQMSGNIRSVSSPSHAEVLRLTSPGGRPGVRASVRSQTFLTQGFILVVRSDGLDQPRCFAERRESRNSGGLRTVALQLTMVPKIRLPPVPEQDYLFLVDRSWSMVNTRITTAKKALAMLLRMLPNSRTFFNIFSFGSKHDALWHHSQPYNEHSLELATRHVDGMDANYGQTELLAALQFVFKNRSKTPTMLFVLTDGLICEPDSVISAVAEEVSRSDTNSPLRVFALGIGNEVSSAVIEGIARVGNGESLFAVHAESIIGKCSRLLHAGRSCYVENVTIDFGLPSRGHNVVRQTPGTDVLKIRAGARFVVYALVTTTERWKLPERVVVHGQLNGADSAPLFEVPVTRVRSIFESKRPETLLVHTLTARHLINDLVEGRASPTSQAVAEEDTLKAAVVDLAEEYQLASRYTSFIAVDEDEEMSTARTYATSLQSRPQEDHLDLASLFPDAAAYLTDLVTLFLDRTSQLLSVGLALFQGDGPSTRGRQRGRRLPGAYSDRSLSYSPSHPHPNHVRDPDRTGDPDDSWDDTDNNSVNTFSTLSTLEGYESDWSFQQSPPPRQRSRSPSPDVQHSRSAGGDQNPSPSALPPLPRPPAPPPPIAPEINNLIQLQQFNGSFTLSNRLGAIVGSSALQKPVDLRLSVSPGIDDDAVWATALAEAYLRKHLAHPGQWDVLDALLDKLREFILAKGAGMESVFDALVERAKELVA